MKILAGNQFDGAYALAALVLTVVTAGFIGCAKSGDTTAAAPAVPGALTAQCNGQLYNAQYGCLDPVGCQSGFGRPAGQNICVAGTVYQSPTTGSNYYTALTSINTGVFNQALQTAGLCDQSSIGGIGKDWGYAACRNYTGSGYLILQGNPSNSAQAMIQIGAGSSNPNIPNQDWSTGGRILVMAGNVGVFPFNNSAGFVATNGGNGIQVIADTGVLGTASSIAVRLTYGGQEFARGTLIRY